MPFTPLHMGPGMAFKAIAGGHFSLLTFGVAQVAMDIEPALGLALGWERLHGWSHTYVGAVAIGLAAMLVGRPIAAVILARFVRELEHYGIGWMQRETRVGWGPAAVGAFVGTFSHVGLDSLMHPDMHPLAPFAAGNALLYAVSGPALVAGCVVAGIAGLVAWAALALLRRKR